MTIRYLLLFLAVVIIVCRGCFSKETNCTAIETSNGTIYIVHGITGSTCDFSWINSSNHVMANIAGKIEEIIISSNSTHLHTHGCYESLVYSWDCMSEMSTTATCHVNCTRNTGRPAAPENPSVWLIVVVIVASILLVILVILFFVYTTVIRRLKQQRYTGGKSGNVNQVEMGLWNH